MLVEFWEDRLTVEVPCNLLGAHIKSGLGQATEPQIAPEGYAIGVCMNEPRLPPDEVIGTFHGSLLHQCMIVSVNGVRG